MTSPPSFRSFPGSLRARPVDGLCRGLRAAVRRVVGCVRAGVPVADAVRGVEGWLRGLRSVEGHNARVDRKWALLCAPGAWREAVMWDLGGPRAMRRWRRRRAEMQARADGLREEVRAALRETLRVAVRDGAEGGLEGGQVVLEVAAHPYLARAVEGLWPALPGSVVASPSRTRVRWGRRRSVCGTYALAGLPGGGDVLRQVRSEASAAGVELRGWVEPSARQAARRRMALARAAVRGVCADGEERRRELREMRAGDRARWREWCARHGRRDPWREAPVEVSPDELERGAALYVHMEAALPRREMRAARARPRRRLGQVRHGWRPGSGRPTSLQTVVQRRGRWPPRWRSGRCA